LLAIFLRNGVKGKTAVDLARDVLSAFGSLRALLEGDRQTFCRTKGLDTAKYVQIQAVLETGLSLPGRRARARRRPDRSPGHPRVPAIPAARLRPGGLFAVSASSLAVTASPMGLSGRETERPASTAGRVVNGGSGPVALWQDEVGQGLLDRPLGLGDRLTRHAREIVNDGTVHQNSAGGIHGADIGGLQG